MKPLLISIILLFIQVSVWADQVVNIIPQPLSVVKGESSFVVNNRTSLVFDKELKEAADYLLEYLPLDTKKQRKNNALRLKLDKELGKEEYKLTIHRKGIEIRGGDYGGVFNGIQSLLQILPPEVYAKHAEFPVEVPCVEIKDAPQYTYRGFLLDVARTFQPVDEVKRVLDYMA